MKGRSDLPAFIAKCPGFSREECQRIGEQVPVATEQGE